MRLQGREQEGFGRRGGIEDLKELASEQSSWEIASSSDYSYAPIAVTATDWFCEAPSADWSASGGGMTQLLSAVPEQRGNAVTRQSCFGLWHTGSALAMHRQCSRMRVG